MQLKILHLGLNKRIPIATVASRNHPIPVENSIHLHLFIRTVLGLAFPQTGNGRSANPIACCLFNLELVPCASICARCLSLSLLPPMCKHNS